MKRKGIAPYILALFFILAFIGISKLFYSYIKNGEKMQPKNLRIASPNKKSITGTDPARVDTVFQAHLVRNLFGRLVEFNPDGQLVAGLSESFEIFDGAVHFKFRETLKTIDGFPITAEDAALSFKRQILLNTNTHGDLRSFLCDSPQFKKITDDCEGIKVEGNKLILIAKNPKRAKFLIPLLASVDFSILPKSIVNWNSEKMEILDYRNTSGAYYLEKDSEEGKYLFKVNPSFYFYSNKMAETIEFVPAVYQESIEKFKNNEIDLITTVDTAQRSKIEALAKETPIGDFHKTFPIVSWKLKFTRPGLKKFTRAQRRFVGKMLRTTEINSMIGAEAKATEVFFPNMGEGGLSQVQTENVRNIFEESVEPEFDKKMIMAVGASYKDQLTKTLAPLSKYIEIRVFTQYAFKLPEHEQPDVFIDAGDTSFFESVSLLSYYFDQGAFGLTRQEGAKWLENYMDIEDKAERLKLLQKLHYDSLMNATVIPLAVESAVALARKPWKIGFSKFFIGSPLWQVTHE